MVLDDKPRTRDAALAVVAVLLVSTVVAPLPVQNDETRYRYERVEVTTEDGLSFADDTVRRRVRLSDEVRCATDWTARICAFERTLLDNDTVPSGIYTNNPDMYPGPGTTRDPYEYVVLNETLYETTYVTNTSVTGPQGLYRVDMTLTRTDPQLALQRLSRPLRSDAIPSVVETAVETGVAHSTRAFTPDATPIAADGTYYRVYRAERVPPTDFAVFTVGLARVVFPVAGLLTLRRVLGRLSVSHTSRSQ